MRKHRTTMSTVSGLFAAALFLGGLTLGQTAEAGKKKKTPCEKAAMLALYADFASAQSDYFIAQGKVLNITDDEDRKEARREARSEYKEQVREAKDVYDARLDLCDRLDEYLYDPAIDPEDFLSPEETAANPNQYFPLVPGTVYTYEGETEEGTETIVVEITDNTVEIMGITCMEVRDTVTLEGEFVEDTLDWYAQHEDGSVWYFGEISFNYEDGVVVDIEGSWKAGVDGAKPGIVMQGTPVVGDAYRQEWLLGEAEDAGEILALGESITVPAGTFNNCLRTLDINPHDPETIENKLFAPGVGFVFEIKPEEGETVELISVVNP